MEQGFISGVLGHGDVTRIAYDAVAPAEESVVFVGRCFQYGSGSIVVDTAAGHGAAFHRVAFGGDFILQNIENGGISGITVHEDRAWVGDVPVIPLVEHIACVATGGQMNAGSIVVSSAAVDGAGTFRSDLRNDVALLNAETGRVSLVFGDDDGTRVVSVVVVPTDKLETEVGRGRNHDGISVIICATTSHITPSWMVGDYIDGELANGKQGDESAVLGDDDVTRVVEVAIVPAEEVMARVGMGFDLDGVAVGKASAATDRTPIGVVGFDGNVENRCG